MGRRVMQHQSIASVHDSANLIQDSSRCCIVRLDSKSGTKSRVAVGMGLVTQKRSVEMDSTLPGWDRPTARGGMQTRCGQLVSFFLSTERL